MGDAFYARWPTRRARDIVPVFQPGTWKRQDTKGESLTTSTSSATDTLIELLDVRKDYGSGEAAVAALSGMNLAIQRGSFVGVIGRSGSGKSTFLNIVGGLDTPSSGQVMIEGVPLKGRSSDDLASYRRQAIGFIFQSFNLVPHLTALENVALPLALAGQGYFERRVRAQTLLEKVGLKSRTSHRPSELSGGERQRVAIARAMSNEPSLLLCDEPTGNLDSKTAEEIMTMLSDLHAKEGRTVILVTHDRERAERYCERLVIMEDGKVSEDYKIGAVPKAAAVKAGKVAKAEAPKPEDEPKPEEESEPDESKPDESGSESGDGDQEASS
jgi:putative ABC transport system ATP-binding protein